MKKEEIIGLQPRNLSGPTRMLLDTMLTLIPVVAIVGILDLPSYFGISFHLQQYVACILGFVISSTFLLMPARRGTPNKVPFYDLLLSVTSLVVGLYVAINFKTIAVDVGVIMFERVLLGILAVLLVLEAARRFVGKGFVIIVVVLLVYALFARFFPGQLKTRSIPFDNLATFLYLDPQGILGIPFEVASTLVLVFMLLGQAMSAIGLNKLFNDVAFGLLGRFRGGPAKVAVVASGLFGMISGSAVANVATTGVFTIPLMKKAGYKPHFAGAVEAVSSTGGQIMPPIMGAAAFIMATSIGVPYAKIAICAFIPAILYYVCVFMQVDLRAAKEGLKGMPREELPMLQDVFRENWPACIPFLVLVYTLFVMRMEAELSGLITVVTTIALAFVAKRRTGITVKQIYGILRNSGEGLLQVGVTCAGAGLIIGTLNITGLAFKFPTVLVSVAAGNIFLLFLMSAIAASILGMGMPVVAAYLLTACIAAPALVNAGISPLVAHFFIFYYGVLSFLTPPVCLAAYAAASVAQANMVQTAVQAMKLGIAAYLVPFIFAYRPALLLLGTAFEILEASVTAIIGVCFIAMGVEGFLFRSLDWWKRALVLVGGFITMIPGVLFDVIGLGIALPVVFMEWKTRRLIKLPIKVPKEVQS
jgi:TRAP transporter 4TM/12TM fusion protein